MDERPEPVTTAISMSPSCSRNQASYRAQAPSISTWESRLGGHAPMASRLETKEKA